MSQSIANNGEGRLIADKNDPDSWGDQMAANYRKRPRTAHRKLQIGYKGAAR